MGFKELHTEFNIITDDELQEYFDLDLPIYFDTNVFRSIWRMHSAPRNSVMDLLKQIKSRLWLPFQTQVELKSQAYTQSVFNSVPRTGLEKARASIENARSGMGGEIAKIRPLPNLDQEGGREIEEIRSDFNNRFDEFLAWFDQIDKQIQALLGVPVDVEAIRSGAATHVLLDELEDLFPADHFLSQPSAEWVQKCVEEYRERNRRDDPIGPGASDSGKATEEQSAGDYLMWREILEHAVQNEFRNGFFFVTEEKKKDLWEMKQEKGAPRRIHPQIQRESIETTGGPMLVVDFQQLMRLAAPLGTADFYSTLAQDVEATEAEWNIQAYRQLLSHLEERGRQDQRDVIVAAAANGGFISRKEIGSILGWGEGKNYLKRFRMPADTVKGILVESKLIHDSVSDPLTAVYRGPGEAVGYSVPDEFVGFEERDDDDPGEI